MQAAWKSETWKTRSAETEATEAARAKRVAVENCILMVVGIWVVMFKSGNWLLSEECRDCCDVNGDDD